MGLIKRSELNTMLTHEQLDNNFEFCASSAKTADEKAVAANVKADSALTEVAAKASKETDNDFEGNQFFKKGIFQKASALAGSAINLEAGALFSKTISAATVFTVEGIPVAGKVGSFVLDLINGGAFAITWWANVKWAAGTPPTLTAVGRDMLGFVTYDGGATWTGMVLGENIK